MGQVMSDNAFTKTNILLGIFLGLVIVAGWVFYPQIQKAFESTFKAVNQDTVPRAQNVSVPAPTVPQTTSVKESPILKFDKTARRIKTVKKVGVMTKDSKAQVLSSALDSDGEAARQDMQSNNKSKGTDLAPEKRYQPSIKGPKEEHFFRFFERQDLAETFIKNWQEASGVEFVMKEEGGVYCIYFLAPEDQRDKTAAQIEQTIGIKPGRRTTY